MAKIGWGLILIVILGILLFAAMMVMQKPEKSEPQPVPQEEQAENPKLTVQDIMHLAEIGKVPDVPFVAGEAKKQDIQQQWGEAQNVAELDNEKYEDYTKQDVTIGYQGELAFDIRSFKADIQNIHLEDIKNNMGEPTETRYYQDEATDQVILVYQVNPTYQLKWILPKPTEAEANPSVHHISVYTKIKDEVAEAINQMTLEEKIGQMMFAGVAGTTLQQETASLIHDFKVGGMILYGNNLETTTQSVNLVNDLMKANADKRLPLFIGTDQEGGNVVRLPGALKNFPTNQKIGAINEAQFSYEIGSLLGEQLKAFGFNLDFAPVLDVNSNPKNPVIGDRSFSNNPQVVSELGIQTMKGLASQQVIPVIKHFPGHGDTSVDSHLALPKVEKSLKDLNETELIPFKAAIESGADVVMVAHILLPKIDQNYPSSMSKEVITGILREQIGFDGVVMTDDMTMGAIANHYDMGQAAVAAVKAGNDIVLMAHGFSNVTSAIEAIKVAVNNGEISEAQINESVRRIIHLKQKYQLVNTPVPAVDINKLNADVERVLNAYMD
ncbi:beta-N-acetylhexosaminidase [Lysinibacillus louembei]|uniref:beta-N-acetylhexosaminidase n=1 Tax=Lysinibacillus louembei TaxID=1470088 RepID=A0ABZ0RZU1_9BACI|nr:beta-N-acetylhexosaminidase [Lysinibacillus louembei]WPK13767.1 beta-N-acetylhexosaminidase [Lysinibacillus louembei]